MSDMTNDLSVALANTYALYLKTQNYHWHVSGVNFSALHELFERQYKELAIQVDDLAERILIVGGRAPATFTEYNQLKTLSDGDSNKKAIEMVTELYEDHDKVIQDLKRVLDDAAKVGDEGTAALLSEQVSQHEKTRWMLGASKS